MGGSGPVTGFAAAGRSGVLVVSQLPVDGLRQIGGHGVVTIEARFGAREVGGLLGSRAGRSQDQGQSPQQEEQAARCRQADTSSIHESDLTFGVDGPRVHPGGQANSKQLAWVAINQS